MRDKLQSALNTLTDLEFFQLSRRIEIANWCRSIMRQYELNDIEMGKELGLIPKRFKHFKFGAFNYTVEDLAKLQATEIRLGLEALKKKVESRIKIGGDKK